MAKISIVIPHYNSCDTLKILMDSIPDREEIQVIVVDDKSNCEFEQIEQAVSGKEKASVMALRNDTDRKGAGVCRNIALKYVTGEWLMFADADDYFSEDMWEIISSHFESEFDIVYFRPISYILGTKERSDKRGRFYEKIMDEYLEAPEDINNQIKMRYSWYVPWSKIIRREVVFDHQITFDETQVANDVMFSTKCGLYAKKIHADNRIIYCVTEQEGTLTQTINEQWFDIRVDAYIRRNEFLEANMPEEQKEVFKFSGTFLVLKALREGYGEEKGHQLIELFKEKGISYSMVAIKKEYPEF